MKEKRQKAKLLVMKGEKPPYDMPDADQLRQLCIE